VNDPPFGKNRKLTVKIHYTEKIFEIGRKNLGVLSPTFQKILATALLYIPVSQL
jgi:hypothetical protein